MLAAPRETVIELATRVVSEAREQRRALDLCACGHFASSHTYPREGMECAYCECRGFTPHPQPRLEPWREQEPPQPQRGDAAREAAVLAELAHHPIASAPDVIGAMKAHGRSLLGPVLAQSGGLGRCIFQPTCATRAAGSQFCLDHDPTRSAVPALVENEPTTARVATPTDNQLIADHYFAGAEMRARLFMLPSGRWHADVTGPGGHFCAISTPDADKAVYFVVRRLRGVA